MAKKKQGPSHQSQSWKKMRWSKLRLKGPAKLKNNNTPVSPGMSAPSMSPGALSSMRVTVSDKDKPSPERRRKRKTKRLRFSQFLEVRSQLLC